MMKFPKRLELIDVQVEISYSKTKKLLFYDYIVQNM